MLETLTFMFNGMLSVKMLTFSFLPLTNFLIYPTLYSTFSQNSKKATKNIKNAITTRIARIETYIKNSISSFVW